MEFNHLLKRVYSLTSPPNSSNQREFGFHSRCTIQGRVCDFTINSGSSTNLVSTYVVEKLGLTTRKHPFPYMLQNSEGQFGVKVEEQVVISFSVGGAYRDEVICDVVYMESCHLLLGRTWQYDRQVLHDGFLNTYSFFDQGKKIVLKPLNYVLPSLSDVEQVANESGLELKSSDEVPSLEEDERDDDLERGGSKVVQSSLAREQGGIACTHMINHTLPTTPRCNPSTQQITNFVLDLDYDASEDLYLHEHIYLSSLGEYSLTCYLRLLVEHSLIMEWLLILSCRVWYIPWCNFLGMKSNWIMGQDHNFFVDKVVDIHGLSSPYCRHTLIAIDTCTAIHVRIWEIAWVCRLLMVELTLHDHLCLWVEKEDHNFFEDFSFGLDVLHSWWVIAWLEYKVCAAQDTSTLV